MTGTAMMEYALSTVSAERVKTVRFPGERGHPGQRISVASPLFAQVLKATCSVEVILRHDTFMYETMCTYQ